MQLKSYLPSQAVRFLDASSEETSKRSPVPFLKEFEERYGFVQIPRTVAELDLQTGITFLRGFFKGKVIEKFQIYHNGVLCEALDDTDFCDEVLDDIFSWAPKYFSEGGKLNVTARAYTSQMEVIAAPDVLSALDRFTKVGWMLSSMRNSYGQTAVPYLLSGFRLNSNPLAGESLRGPDFAFERRTGSDYSTGLYYTVAPLKTSDHWLTLEALQSILNSK
ncbi:hypothetical protein [Bradyrhizobium liaoningense]|uniref:hypothetical protein n=1 Tax=Bradyrhizobium liaoningense TaxID=43992 RepID=UPI001BA96B47|nr:hypothetical protein [Bradyrhizobium liaoningense]MBR0855632.1 hypothetical protein [Bradyrhizobium liaoningense]